MARSGIALGAVVAAVVAFAASPATATTVDPCLARKLGDVGKSLAARAACYARAAARPNAAALAACLEKAARRFAGGVSPEKGQFARLERVWPCVTTGDQAALDAALAAYAAGLDAQVANSGAPSRCDAAKLTCVGRYVTGVTRCHARAALRTGGVNGARGCLDRAERSAAACSASGDTDALATGADRFVAAALCALDPAGTPGCAGVPPTPARTPAPTRSPTPTPAGSATPTPTASATDPAQLCVDTINVHRASIGLPPYARWTAAEACVDAQSLADSQSGVPHSAFGQCGEWAQNECPGWPGPPAQMIGSCLQAMWNEGPGQDFGAHGHYINMTSTTYTRVACGFSVLPNGAVWAAQDFR
jgi:hypothetical protein